MPKLNHVQRIKDRFLSEDKMTKQRPMTKAQLQLISAKYHLLYNSNSYYFFFRSCRQYLPTSPNPRWQLQIVLHIFSNYSQVIIFLHLGGEAARCDLWHNNAGLAQIWEGSSQGPDCWQPVMILKIAKSKSRTDMIHFLKPSRWSRSTRRSWKRWERGTRRRRWPFRSLNVLPSTRSARSVEVYIHGND